MQRLTIRNQDNSISVEEVSQKELLQHLAACEDQIEKYEKTLQRMEALERQYFYYFGRNQLAVYQGKYSATHKCVELMRGAKNGR